MTPQNVQYLMEVHFDLAIILQLYVFSSLTCLQPPQKTHCDVWCYVRFTQQGMT